MKILTYIKSHVVLSSAISIVAILIMIIAGRVASRDGTVDTNQSNIKKVSLVSVESFRNDVSRIGAQGIVESVSQVDLRSQVSGQLAAVNLSVGDIVERGQVIASIQNADIRAQLDQARALLALAQGQVSGSGISLESARKSAIEILRSSYLTADEIINIQLSQTLYESTGGSPSLSSFIVDRTLNDSIRNNYLTLKNTIPNWKKSIDVLTTTSSNTDIQKAIIESQKNLALTSVLLDTVAIAINGAIKDTPAGVTYTILTGWQALFTSARASTNIAIKNLIGAESGLSGSEASISSAQANLKNLEAQLSKTVFTSPISGKIAALPLRSGELVQPGGLIATVVGGGDMQIIAYASGEDLLKIKVDASVHIQGGAKGKVIRVAPSVNQINKKIEVKVAVENSTSTTLVVGQNVDLSIIFATQTNAGEKYLLPIQNIKVVPGNAFVYTVDSESRIVENPVTIGKIQGDFAEILTGITSDMNIVSPVYELNPSEKVIIIANE